MTATITSIKRPRLREALDQIRPLMGALAKKELRIVNLNPRDASALVRDAIPELVAMRSTFLTCLPDFDVSNLDQLETYSLALYQAETIFAAVHTDPERLPEALEEGLALRASLVAESASLVHQNLLSNSLLSQLNVPNGYKNVGSDLLTLSGLLRELWSKIASKTAIELAQLDRAEVLAEMLLSVARKRRQRTIEAATAADTRKRAFTLFIKAYEEVRAGVLYLRRHEGDAEELAPSLYRKQKKGRGKPRVASSNSDGNTVMNCTMTSTSDTQESQPSSVRKIIDDPFIL